MQCRYFKIILHIMIEQRFWYKCNFVDVHHLHVFIISFRNSVHHFVTRNSANNYDNNGTIYGFDKCLYQLLVITLRIL